MFSGNEKKLKLAEPLLSTWSSESHLMSMILNQQNAYQWLMNNYIQIIGCYIEKEERTLFCFFPKHDPMDNDFRIHAWNTCPFLDLEYVSKKYVNEFYGSIVDYVKVSIDNDYYVYLDLSQKKLSNGIKKMITHKTFIYGYDFNKELIYVADHYDAGKYALSEIKFTNFIDAYEDANLFLNKPSEENIYEKRKILICKSRSVSYKYNVDWFKMQLKDYLNSEYSLGCIASINNNVNNEFVYGIKCYDLIIKYINKLMEFRGSYREDAKIFTFLCDHKKMLKLHIQYFLENNMVKFDSIELEGYDFLFNLSDLTKILFLKYMMSHKIELLEKIINNLNLMRCKEYELLMRLYNKI